MSNKAKTILWILALAAFFAVASVLYSLLGAGVETPVVLPEQEEASAEANEPAAPDFTVLDESGGEVKLSDMRGKPVVLNFWASWCPPCKSEMPEFDKVYKELGGEITFMMIDLADNQRETIETGKAYIEKQGYSFPVYYDTTGEAADNYGVSLIPTTVFINGDGVLVTLAQGAIDRDTLLKGIEMIRKD
ncbi:MAG: TlpA family protein disulfide reductase [Christensenellaceae bacterium]|jgi:thiol-disulfide isomerase/thioredoxin|nr:TlpA family protein disulfide reductase [Christensenellaceae bacterium]